MWPNSCTFPPWIPEFINIILCTAMQMYAFIDINSVQDKATPSVYGYKSCTDTVHRRTMKTAYRYKQQNCLSSRTDAFEDQGTRCAEDL